MNIKLELLKAHITDLVNDYIEDLEIDADNIADTIAIKALAEIQEIIKNENYSDFDATEKIVGIFEKYQLSFSFRHDF